MEKKDIVEMEEKDLRRVESNRESLKGKWFKNSSRRGLIEYLDLYCKEKQKFIDKIK